jgi:hypothetical protein
LTLSVKYLLSGWPLSFARLSLEQMITLS